MSKPIAAARSSSRVAVANVPCTGRPSASQPPVERGKNSYQAPARASERSTWTWWVSPSVTSSRTGYSVMVRCTGTDSASPTRWGSSSSVSRSSAAAFVSVRARSSTGGIAMPPVRSLAGSSSATRGVSRRRCSMPSAARSSSRAPDSRSLDSSAAPWPARVLTSTAWRHVAHGSLHASTRKLHRPSTSGTTWPANRSVSGPVGTMRVLRGASSPHGIVASGSCPWLWAPQRCQTTVAATASWPSRQTVASTGTTSPTTAFDGNRPPETSGVTSSIPSRPCGRACRSIASAGMPARGAGAGVVVVSAVAVVASVVAVVVVSGLVAGAAAVGETAAASVAGAPAGSSAGTSAPSGSVTVTSPGASPPRRSVSADAAVSAAGTSSRGWSAGRRPGRRQGRRRDRPAAARCRGGRRRPGRRDDRVPRTRSWPAGRRGADGGRSASGRRDGHRVPGTRSSPAGRRGRGCPARATRVPRCPATAARGARGVLRGARRLLGAVGGPRRSAGREPGDAQTCGARGGGAPARAGVGRAVRRGVLRGVTRVHGRRLGLVVRGGRGADGRVGRPGHEPGRVVGGRLGSIREGPDPYRDGPGQDDPRPAGSRVRSSGRDRGPTTRSCLVRYPQPAESMRTVGRGSTRGAWRADRWRRPRAGSRAGATAGASGWGSRRSPSRSACRACPRRPRGSRWGA